VVTFEGRIGINTLVPPPILIILPLPGVLIELLQSLIVGHACTRFHLVTACAIGEDEHPIRRLAVCPLAVKLDFVCPCVYAVPILHVVAVLALVFAAISKCVHTISVHLILVIHTNIAASALERCCPPASALAI